MDLQLGDWSSVLKEELKALYFLELLQNLKKERKLYTVFPKEEDVFKAFLSVPFAKVKVVLLGQDPYHGEGQAMGLSFSVPKNCKIPPSLKNISKELHRDLQVPLFMHGDLQTWAKQGVLLLNTILTVREGSAKSHEQMGWERFTDRVVQEIANKTEPVVFLLLGKKAEEKIQIIKSKADLHIFITAAHPSPFSAKKFIGSGVFSKVNEALQQINQTPIDWNIG